MIMDKKQVLEQLKRESKELGLEAREVAEYFSSKKVLQSFFGKSHSAILPGMFIYADNLIFPELILGRQVKAVVGYVENNVAYGICLHRTLLPWFNYSFTPSGSLWARNVELEVPETRKILNGQEATSKILNACSQYPDAEVAARWCANYCADGVARGEAFLPSIFEAKKVIANEAIINESFTKLDIFPLEWILSSTESDKADRAWAINKRLGLFHCGEITPEVYETSVEKSQEVFVIPMIKIQL